MKKMSLLVLLLVSFSVFAGENRGVQDCIKKVEDVLRLNTASTAVFKGRNCTVSISSGIDETGLPDLSISAGLLFINLPTSDQYESLKLVTCDVSDNKIRISTKGRYKWAERRSFSQDVTINFELGVIKDVKLDYKESRLFTTLKHLKSKCE